MLRWRVKDGFSGLFLVAAFTAWFGVAAPLSATSIVNTVSPACRPLLMNRELADLACEGFTGLKCPLNVRQYQNCLHRELGLSVTDAMTRLEPFAALRAEVETTAEFLRARKVCPPDADVASTREAFLSRLGRLRRVIAQVVTLKDMVAIDYKSDISDAFYKGLVGNTIGEWLEWSEQVGSHLDSDVARLTEMSWELDGVEESIKSRIVMPANCDPVAVTEDDSVTTPAEPCDLMPGVWQWFVGGTVTFSADHTLSVGGEKFGTWSCSGTDVTVVWKQGFTDELTLSSDGSSLAGRNQYNTGVSGSRIGDADE